MNDDMALKDYYIGLYLFLWINVQAFCFVFYSFAPQVFLLTLNRHVSIISTPGFSIKLCEFKLPEYYET